MVLLPLWFEHPEPTAQGKQRHRFQSFNFNWDISSGMPLWAWRKDDKYQYLRLLLPYDKNISRDLPIVYLEYGGREVPPRTNTQGIPEFTAGDSLLNYSGMIRSGTATSMDAG